MQSPSPRRKHLVSGSLMSLEISSVYFQRGEHLLPASWFGCPLGLMPENLRVHLFLETMVEIIIRVHFHSFLSITL